MSTFTYPAPAPSRVLRLPRLSRGGAQVALFFLAYLVYSGARYFTIGDLGDATTMPIANAKPTCRLGTAASSL